MIYKCPYCIESRGEGIPYGAFFCGLEPHTHDRFKEHLRTCDQRPKYVVPTILKQMYLGSLALLDYLLVWSAFWLILLLVWSLCIEHVDDAAILFMVLLSVSFADYLLVKYWIPPRK